MVERSTTDIHPINSSDDYVFVERVGKKLIKSDEYISKYKSFDKVLLDSNSDSWNIDYSFPNLNRTSVKDSSLINTDLIVDVAESASIECNSEENDSAEHLDTERTGESQIKYYYFDASEHNSDTDKCIEFWKTIKECEDLKPVDCRFSMERYEALYTTDSMLNVKKHDHSIIVMDQCDTNLGMAKTEDEVPEVSSEYVWYNALQDMKKRNMDKVASAATGQRCKLCDRKAPSCGKTSKADTDDIVGLNMWKPVSINKSLSAKEVINKVVRSGEQHQQNRVKETKITAIGQPKALTPLESPTLDNSKLEKPIQHERKQDMQKEDRQKADQEKQDKPKHSDKKVTKKLDKPKQVEHRNQIAQAISCSCICVHGTTLKCEELKSKSAPTVSDVQVKKVLPEITGLDSKRQSDEKIVDLNEIECKICHEIECKCQEHIEKQAKEFIDELRYELKNIRIDKSCMAIETADSVRNVKPKYCTVCRDVVNICDVMHGKLLGLELDTVPVEEDQFIETIFQADAEYESFTNIEFTEPQVVNKTIEPPPSNPKLKKVTYVKSGSSSAVNEGNEFSKVILPKSSIRESVMFDGQSVTSDESIIIFQKPMSWYTSELPD